MRIPHRAILLLLCLGPALCALGGRVTILLKAPAHAGGRVQLYRYLDLLTLRTEALADAAIDAQGTAMLQADVSGTVKATLRIGTLNGDLWLRGGQYTIGFPAADPRRPRSVNGTTEVDLTFTDVDRMDVNALMADLNMRLDDFIAQDLATDRQAGMQAAERVRRGEGTAVPDTAKRPATLFITPGWSEARVDTFGEKLRRYYAGVDDPWFQANLEYGIAGLRFGPGVNDRDLYDRHLKDRPVLVDVPEYVRFVCAFFEEQLQRGPFRTHEQALLVAVQRADLDSVKALFAESDFLKDPVLCELITLRELHLNQNGRLLDRQGILSMLDRAAAHPATPELGRIAGNMAWDLTAMKPGGHLPALVLRDLEGRQVRLDTLGREATCVAVTAAWCTYCAQELVALEALSKEYGAYLNVIAISLDSDLKELRAYLSAHPGQDWTWYYGGDDPAVMDALRLRTVPAFFLLNDAVLVHAPAPAPSNGLAAILHKLKVQADERNKLKPDQGPPPRQRR
jgi:thiol-disulfide isomerase/thioredoxin